jgi:hypothetical protein
VANDVVIKVATKGVAEARRALDDVRGSGEGLSRGLSRVGGAMTLGVTAPIVAGATAAVMALGRIEKISAQTDAAIESTGGAANVSRTEIEDMAASLEKLTSVEAEAIQEGQNMLLTFTKVKNEVGEGNDIFDRATKAALDFSVATGTDMTAASLLVGKALNDPMKGLTALSRAGVGFTAEQKKMITEMVAAGDTMGAQKIILGELTTQFGGSAEALGGTMVGKIQKVKNAFGEVAETLASALIPILESFTGWLQKMADWFNNLNPVAQKMIGVFIALVAAVGPMLLIGSKLVTAFGIIKAAWVGLNISFSITPWGALIAGIVVLVTLIIMNWDKVKAFLERTWEVIKKAAKAAWDWISGVVKGAVDFIVKLFLNFTLPGLLIKHWDKIKEGVRAVVDTVKAIWDGIVGFFSGLPGRIGRAVSGMFDGIKNAFRTAVNFLIDKWNSFELKIGGFKWRLPSITIPNPFGDDWKLGGNTWNIPGFELKTPNIPRLHSGGMFRAPTPGGEGLAILKDRETVIPAGGEGGTLHVLLELDGTQIAEALVPAFTKKMRRDGNVGFAAGV